MTFNSIQFLLYALLMAGICPAFGQKNIDATDAQKVVKDGVEITAFQGKPFTGTVTQKYPNGKPQKWVTLKEGLPDGLWQEWYENGFLKYNAYWLQGKGHGPWAYYHANGVLRQEEFYNMDIPTGIFREYYENGTLKVKSAWLNGKQHGTWTYYSETGLITKTELFENGELLKTNTPSK